DVERELAPYAKSMHSIVVYPRNAATSEPDIVLELANYETFNKALEEMGKDRDEISRLTNASGRSLTVLRRQLSTVPAVRTPEWAADRQTAASLVPFLFVGAWNSQNETDTLALLAVHGKHLFKSRLGIDTEIEAVRVVRDLLPTPLTTRILEANDRDLPTYAEAAPDEFLSILERNLKADEPAVLGLLRPVD